MQQKNYSILINILNNFHIGLNLIKMFLNLIRFAI